jgi:hypothetical protein
MGHFPRTPSPPCLLPSGPGGLRGNAPLSPLRLTSMANFFLNQNLFQTELLCYNVI